MPCAEQSRPAWNWLRTALAVAWVSAVLVACGGGNSTQVTYSGPGTLPGVAPVAVVVQAEPTGPNTTEVLVTGEFAPGAANIPYVTVTVCTPGSSSQCATIDHVILDTGSYGLRVFSSKVQALGLPAVQLTASPINGTAVECYPFVVGGLWGPLAYADVLIAGESASNIPVQLIDDLGRTGTGPTADCLAATNNQVLTSAVGAAFAPGLQANGVLGVGMVGVDCGATCRNGNYAGGHVQYYVCPDSATVNCTPAAIPDALQTQNPVVHFAVNKNGTIISLPPLPTLGAGKARGRLVFGIGTQTNNQPTGSANTLYVDTDPANFLTTYLYVTTTLGSQSYIQSYIDSGSNALFFDDASLSKQCQVNSGVSQGGWYCPAQAANLLANLSDLDPKGNLAAVNFTVYSADALFNTPSTGSAFSNLAGAVGQGKQSFVWGLPFFYGRSVYTSIWGQSLSDGKGGSHNGPWYAFCDLKAGVHCPGAPPAP